MPASALPPAMRHVADAAAFYGCSDGKMGTGKGWCLLTVARLRHAVLATHEDASAAAAALRGGAAVTTLPIALKATGR